MESFTQKTFNQTSQKQIGFRQSEHPLGQSNWQGQAIKFIQNGNET